MKYSFPRYRILTLDFQFFHVTCYFFIRLFLLKNVTLSRAPAIVPARVHRMDRSSLIFSKLQPISSKTWISKRQKGLHKIATNKVFTDTETQSKKTLTHRKEQVIFDIKTPTKKTQQHPTEKNFLKAIKNPTPQLRWCVVIWLLSVVYKDTSLFRNYWDRKVKKSHEKWCAC